MSGYVVVTPAFDEEQSLGRTIESMVQQSVPPEAWVIVDDGSSDGTWRLIAEAEKATSFIRGLRRERDRAAGDDGLLLASEALAFLDGLPLALEACPEPDFIVKLDADLAFAPDYFARLLAEFAADPKLGIAGGMIYEQRGQALVKERVQPDHVRGATKVYRRACYEEIGGVRPLFGWDAVDELLARRRGWHARSFDPPALLHLRRTASRGGRVRGWARNGRMAYYVGFSPLRMLARCAYRLLHDLDPAASWGLLRGYFGQWLARAPRAADPEILAAVSEQEWRR